jgi:hypothetical protein
VETLRPAVFLTILRKTALSVQERGKGASRTSGCSKTA